MNLITFVYLTSMLDGLNIIVAVITILVVGGTVICGISHFVWESSVREYSWNLDSNKQLKSIVVSFRNKVYKMFKIGAIVTPLLLLFCVLIPSKKTAYLMAGAYVVQQVVEDPRTREVSDKIIKIISKNLDEYLEEPMKKVKQ